MNKVYCKDCKFIGEVGTYLDFSLEYSCEYFRYTPFSDYVNCKDANKNGECILYTRKWYKFWLREEGDEKN